MYSALSLFVLMASIAWGAPQEATLPAQGVEQQQQPEAQLAAVNWPNFRGPSGLGYSSSKNLPLQWGGEKSENVIWKSPLVGEGHASPIVWGDRLLDRKSTRLNSSHVSESRMPSSA